MSIIEPPRHGGGSERKPNICIKCGKDMTFWDWAISARYHLKFGTHTQFRFYIVPICRKCDRGNIRILFFKIRFTPTGREYGI